MRGNATIDNKYITYDMLEDISLCGGGDEGTCNNRQQIYKIWDMQKWAFVYLGHTKVVICVCVVLGLGYALFAIVHVWYWGWDMQKWAFVYLGHTKVDICVCVVLGLGYA
jgi:hypothetical protein